MQQGEKHGALLKKHSNIKYSLIPTYHSVSQITKTDKQPQAFWKNGLPLNFKNY
jgi:hypothetical protein